jgi:hypothetical protein
MSTPRDRDGFDDEAGRSWQEPAHLGGEPGADEPNIADRRKQPRDEDATGSGDSWQPSGWDLPPADPREEAAADRPGAADPGGAPGGLFGRRPRPAPAPGPADRVFEYEGDVVGAQGWALQHGWTISDGSGPEDAVLRELIDSAPVRPTKDHRAASVLRGRGGNLELVAFDIVYASGRYLVPEYAVTAAPMLGAVPRFRLSPARFWKHRTGGLLPIASGNEQFDARWLLLTAEDTPQIRRLAGDSTVQALLLGTDDGDELWSAAGHVAAIRLDGHRPQLIEHHTRLLTAVVGALAAGY